MRVNLNSLGVIVETEGIQHLEDAKKVFFSLQKKKKVKKSIPNLMSPYLCLWSLFSYIFFEKNFF